MASDETFLGNNEDGGSPDPTPKGNEGGDKPSTPPDWIGALPEDARGYIENKGWKEPGDVLKGYQHLEGLLGADKAGRGVVLPKDDKDQEALDKIYNAMGRPEKADGYGLTELLAKEETTDPAFMAAMGETMHQAGLSKAQAHKLAGAYQAHYNANRQAAIETHQKEVADAKASLTPEEKENCHRGFRFLGLNNEEAAAIEMYWGVKRAAQMFAKIGQALSEDKRVDGSAPGGFTGSPEAAKARLAELDADPAFTKRYLEGEPAAVKMKEDLFKKVAEA
jgi:hypothetical protein